MHALLLFTAKYLVFVACLIALVYWLKVPSAEKKRLVFYGVITAVSAYLLAKLGSALYYDPRPFVGHNITPLYPHAPDNGFPSDHTLLAAFIAFTIYSSSKKLGIVLLVVAVLVGAARVIGHIHSPIDIVGSILFALAGAALASFATPYLMKRLRIK